MSRSRDLGVHIKLDARVPLESMVLNRLRRLPWERRNEWLRNLLVQGFKLECQSLKSTNSQKVSAAAKKPHCVSISTPEKVTPLHAGEGVQVAEKDLLWRQSEPEQDESLEGEEGTKPFAQLKKVMG